MPAATLGSVDADLARSAQRYWQQRQVHLSMTTVFTAPEQPSGGLRVGWWTGRAGVQYCLLPLSQRGESESIGLLACALSTRAVREEVWPLAAAICLRLDELGDLPELDAG